MLSQLTHNDRALCWCGIRIPSARNRCPAFAKDKYLEPMFGDVGQARTNAAMLLLMIDKTLSRTCTKPIVGCRFNYLISCQYNRQNMVSLYAQQLFYILQVLSTVLVYVNGFLLCQERNYD